MDPALLQTLITAGVSLLSLVIYHKTVAVKSPASTPEIPSVMPAISSAPAPNSAIDTLNRVLIPWLNSQLSPAPAKPPASVADQVAITALTQILKGHPATPANVRSAL
jgi:hypothetical protein